MIHVHIGAPGIAPDILNTLAAIEPVKSAEDVYLVPSTAYRSLFHGLVDAKANFVPPDPDRIRDINEFLHQASGLRNVAISQPGFFGLPSDALRARKSFPLAEARAGRLSELIGASSMTFHLAITSQVDYILKMRRMSEADRLSAIRDAQFSWSDLAFRIRRGAPGRGIIVWDFDRPKSIARAFVETLLGLTAEPMKHQILKAISRDSAPIGSGPIDFNDDTLAKAVDRLDAKYEHDLDNLERMPGVTLIRHENILPELHI